ncbi:MAG: thiamine pyrophosphate-binding protein [Pseudomonas sp.]|nr:thiamine pyrophosphate-binding protein [Pseudomonas sp.]
MSQTHTAPPSPLRRTWLKWRFHLNALLILVPLGFMPQYFKDVAFFRGESGLGKHLVGEVQVGPWSLTLADFRNLPPEFEGDEGYLTTFKAALCSACIEPIKATFLRVGEPASLLDAGVALAGSPYGQTAEVPIPDTAKADDDLWITMEGWDGSVHSAHLPLRQAAPATAAWLERRP